MTATTPMPAVDEITVEIEAGDRLRVSGPRIAALSAAERDELRAQLAEDMETVLSRVYGADEGLTDLAAAPWPELDECAAEADAMQALAADSARVPRPGVSR